MKATEGLLKRMQIAFQTIAILQINAYMWPKQVTAAVQPGDIFDYIVAGGGTAGCVVAARLAEDKKSTVLLLEAGGNPPLENNNPGTYSNKSDVDWGYSSTDDGYSSQCQNSHQQDLRLSKMLGGTSNLNFLHFSPGTRQDYNTWAKITNDTSWCYINLIPYFTKAFENIPPSFSCNDENCPVQKQAKISITKDPSIDYDDIYLNGFKEAGNEIVTSLNGDNTTLGYTSAMYNIGNGMRQSTAYTYITPVKDYPNLFVLNNTLVTKILFDKHKVAVGVEIVLESGEKITLKARKEIVASAGAINSAKLLMLSGVGPAKHLESMGIKVVTDLPVGENFQDQVAVTIIQNMTKLYAPVGVRNSRKYPANVLTGCFNVDKEKNYPEACSVNYINYANYLVQLCSIYGLSDDICNNMFGEGNKNQMLYSMINLSRPKSRGYVKLKSKDYKDAPIVMTGFYSDNWDLDRIALYIQQFLRVSKTSSFKSADAEFVKPKLSKCDLYEFGSNEYWRCYAMCLMSSRRHYAGTNAMGRVVDGRLRVLGVQKLRVVDASVMPLVTRTETFGPTVIIAEKAADMIKADNGIGDEK